MKIKFKNMKGEDVQIVKKDLPTDFKFHFSIFYLPNSATIPKANSVAPSRYTILQVCILYINLTVAPFLLPTHISVLILSFIKMIF